MASSLSIILAMNRYFVLVSTTLKKLKLVIRILSFILMPKQKIKIATKLSKVSSQVWSLDFRALSLLRGVTLDAKFLIKLLIHNTMSLIQVKKWSNVLSSKKFHSHLTGTEDMMWLAVDSSNFAVLSTTFSGIGHYSGGRYSNIKDITNEIYKS